MTAADPGKAKKIPYQLPDLRWLYEELLRIEKHWTGQVQDQQARISTLINVSGILLGFLAGAGFLAKPDVAVPRWPVYLYVLSLVSLCFALFIGIRALKPEIRIARDPPPWLDQGLILDDAGSLSPEDLLRKLCESAADNQKDARHPERLRERRVWMLRQIALLMLSLGLLVGALAGVLFARTPA
jgi:hypothetical protein